MKQFSRLTDFFLVIIFAQRMSRTSTPTATSKTSRSSIISTVAGVRMEFLTQCLTQLVNSRSPTGAVYVLAMRWCIDGKYHVNNNNPNNVNNSNNTNNNCNSFTMTNTTDPSLTLDAVRLQHLKILLSVGGGNRDEEAEQMVPQVQLWRIMCFSYS